VVAISLFLQVPAVEAGPGRPPTVRQNLYSLSCEAITSKYIEAYYEDMGKLGIRRATQEPRATAHIAEIVNLTEA
jgi:cysteinyl-tRNA synthetase